MPGPLHVRVEFISDTLLSVAHLCMEGCGFERIRTTDVGGIPTAWGQCCPDIAPDWALTALDESDKVVWYDIL